jgi:NAD(P)-dependent dehydrogenase (short-subunit alcohol dehydrogenase family)
MMASTLLGRSALVTGASRGLGRAIAIQMAEAGAHVALVARSEDELGRSVDSTTAARTDGNQLVTGYAGNVADEPTMRRVLDDWTARAGTTTVLVNNAAIQGPIGAFDQVSWERWVEALQIDLIAPIQLARLVVPGMRACGHGKIINISGGGATGPRPRFSAYATAKCGLVRFTETLAAELSGTGIDVNAIAPGPMNTAMLDEVLDAGSDLVGPEYEAALRQRDRGGVQPERAARLAVFLASAKSNGITGRLLSAVWDPWESLPEHRDELAGSDIYTLRRIVPKDRGQGWGDR